MKPVEIEIPLEKMEGKQSCRIQLIQHLDTTESLICRTVLENSRKVKLVAKLHLMPKKDCNGHEWRVSCDSMSTNSYKNERWQDAMSMFRFWLSVFTSMVREEPETN